MMRSFFRALAAGLRNAFGFIFAIFAWPFALFMRRPRQSLSSALDEMKAQLQRPAEKPSDDVQSRLREEYVKDSVVAWSFINGCINDGKTRPVPSTLSHKMREWLQGLDYSQLVALKTAGPVGVFEHVASKRVVAGVPPLRKLPAITVQYPAEVLVPETDETPAMLRSFA
jgi:hypothetical protein